LYLAACCGGWPRCRWRLDKSWRLACEQPEIKKGEGEVGETRFKALRFRVFRSPERSSLAAIIAWNPK